jgi:adenylate kinase family enzyme
MKIAIIGYSGSGKSTLAKRLAQELGIEPLYLDRVHFLPNWAEREPEAAREIVREEMAKVDWVIDGNYRYLLREERLRDSDEIIWLNYPRLICLMRALKRYRDFRGKTRESATDGCSERMNWEFLWWILHKGRTRAMLRGYQEVVRRYPEKTAVIRNDRALQQYLDNRPKKNESDTSI